MGLWREELLLVQVVKEGSTKVEIGKSDHFLESYFVVSGFFFCMFSYFLPFFPYFFFLFFSLFSFWKESFIP